MGGYLKLVPYSDVRRRIEGALSGVRPSVERVPVDLASGKVSAEGVAFPCDIPEATSSMMDGYAIRSSEVRSASASHPVSFKVVGSLSPASVRPATRLTGRDAYYVATGAPVPVSADAVVKVEEARPSGDSILVSVSLPRWKNIALRGEDVRAGSTVVRVGQIVNAADIALLVAAGKRDLDVFRSPTVGILSTGDELTRPGGRESGKRVNNYANLIAAYLLESGATPIRLGIAGDDEEQIAKMMVKGIRDLDALVTIGGSSVGTKDFTARAARRIDGCEEIFHGIRLAPARPTGMFMFRGKPMVLLPGHSVAASLAFFLVVHPIINILSGLEFNSRLTLITARLSQGLSNPRPITTLFLVSLTTQDGAYSASPMTWGSNLISSLARANAFLQVGPHSVVREGQSVTVTLLGGREIQRVHAGAVQ